MSPLDFEGKPVIVGSNVLVVTKEAKRVNPYYAKVVELTNDKIRVRCKEHLNTIWIGEQSTVMVC